MSILNSYPVVVLERIVVEDYLKTERRHTQNSSKKVGLKLSDVVLRKGKVSRTSKEKSEKDGANVVPLVVKSKVTKSLKDDSNSQIEAFISDLVVEVKKENEDPNEITPELPGFLDPEFSSERKRLSKDIGCREAPVTSTEYIKETCTSNSTFNIKKETESGEIIQELVGFLSDHSLGENQIPLQLIKSENLQHENDANERDLCVGSKLTVNNDLKESVNSSQIHSDLSCVEQAHSSKAFEGPSLESLEKVCSDKSSCSRTSGHVKVRNTKAKRLSKNNETKKSEQSLDSEIALREKIDKILSEYKQSLAGKEESYQKHSKLHTSKNRFRCNQCPSAFKIESQLKIHLMKHSSERPLECYYCFKKFKYKRGLKLHIALHCEERRYQGEKGAKNSSSCTKNFCQRPNLNVPSTVHEEVKQSNCSQCSKVFPQTNARDCDGKSPKCDQCLAESKQKDSLDSHFEVNSDGIPFKSPENLSMQQEDTDDELEICFEGERCRPDHDITINDILVESNSLQNQSETLPDFTSNDPINDSRRLGGSFTQEEMHLNQSIGRENEGAGEVTYELVGNLSECRAAAERNPLHVVQENIKNNDKKGDRSGLCLEKVPSEKITFGDVIERSIINAFKSQSKVCSDLSSVRECEVFPKILGKVDGKNLSKDSSVRSELKNRLKARCSQNQGTEKFQQSSSSEVELNGHSRIQHKPSITAGMLPTEQNPYQCYFCPKKFSHLHLLKNHLKVHSHERAFKCPRCSAAFKLRKRLDLHMKLHSNETQSQATEMISVPTEDSNVFNDKRHQCSYCPKKFRRADHYKNHLTTHSNERAFECPECPATFKLKDKLRNHMISHSVGRSLVCSYCKKSLKKKVYLKIHMFLHRQKSPFNCIFCPKTYTEINSLCRHVRVCHSKKPYEYLRHLILTQYNEAENDSDDEPIVCFDNTLRRSVSDNVVNNIASDNSLQSSSKVYRDLRINRLLDDSRNPEAVTLKNLGNLAEMPSPYAMNEIPQADKFANESLEFNHDQSSSENQAPTLARRDVLIALDECEESIFEDENALNIPSSDQIFINDGLEESSFVFGDLALRSPASDDLIIADPLEESSAWLGNDDDCNNAFNDPIVEKCTITGACDESSLCFDNNAFSVGVDSMLTVNNTLKESSINFQAFNFPAVDNAFKASSICFDNNGPNVPVDNELCISNSLSEPSIPYDDNAMSVPVDGKLAINNFPNESSVCFDKKRLNIPVRNIRDILTNKNVSEVSSVCLDKNILNVPKSNRLTNCNSPNNSSVSFDSNDRPNVPIAGEFTTNIAEDVSLCSDNNVPNVTICNTQTQNNIPKQSSTYFDSNAFNVPGTNDSTSIYSDNNAINSSVQNTFIANNALEDSLNPSHAVSEVDDDISIIEESITFSRPNNVAPIALVHFDSNVNNASIGDRLTVNNAVSDSIGNTLSARSYLEDFSNSLQAESEVDDDVSIIEESLSSSRPLGVGNNLNEGASSLEYYRGEPRKNFSPESTFSKCVLKVHNDQTRYKCIECKFEFKFECSFIKHTKTECEKKKIVCDECGKKFWHAAHLKRHLLLHGEDKPFACGLCPKRFRRADHASVHIKAHAKQYKCDVCSKRFRRIDYFQQHLKRHECRL